MKNPYSLLLSVSISILTLSCNKPSSTSSPTPPVVLSSEKTITSFVFKASNNSALTADVQGTIGQDTIQLTLPSGVPLTSLAPTIVYKGSSIIPQNNLTQNFTNPVVYTVTAEDKTTKNYVVAVKNALSTSKAITSFTLKAANNPGLSSDIVGKISSDTILLVVQNGVQISNLVPTIVSTGASVSPASLAAQDFSHTVVYTVTAQDGTTKTYKVYLMTEASPGTIFINTLPEGVAIPGAGKVYAIDAATGLKRWSYGTNSTSFVSSPAFSNGILYTADWNKIIAIDTVTRRPMWQYTAGNGVGSSLAVVNGVVYANCNDSYMYAIDAATGSLKWRFAQQTTDTLHGNSSSPTVVNGVVYFGSRDQYVYALDALTGNLKWKTFNSYGAGGGLFQSSPAVVNGVLYIGDAYRNLLALDASTGTIKWVFTAGGLFYSSPTVINGVVYIGSSDGNLYAINASDGSKKWNNYSGPQISTSPIVSGGAVFYGNNGGGGGHGFWALDANTGNQKWVYTFGTDFGSSPVVLGGTVFIASYNTLLALDVNTGMLKWSFVTDDTKEAIIASPCIVDQSGGVHYPSISGHQD
jgi:eukaryotic-like serine/threonine-protein kinase